MNGTGIEYQGETTQKHHDSVYIRKTWNVTSRKGGRRFTVSAMYRNGTFVRWIITALSNGYRQTVGQWFDHMTQAQARYKTIRGELSLIEAELFPLEPAQSPLN